MRHRVRWEGLFTKPLYAFQKAHTIAQVCRNPAFSSASVSGWDGAIASSQMGVMQQWRSDNR
jgi:hypothetical protein